MKKNESRPKEGEIAVRMRVYRARARLSQRDLATALGVSQRYVSYIETGRRTPGDGIARRFADLERRATLATA